MSSEQVNQTSELFDVVNKSITNNTTSVVCNILSNFIDMVHKTKDTSKDGLQKLMVQCVGGLINGIQQSNFNKQIVDFSPSSFSSGKRCPVINKSGPNEGKPCDGSISKLSGTGCFCFRHLSHDEIYVANKAKSAKVMTPPSGRSDTCIAPTKTGKNPGQPCGVKVNFEKSHSHVYCGRHAKIFSGTDLSPASSPSNTSMETDDNNSVADESKETKKVKEEPKKSGLKPVKSEYKDENDETKIGWVCIFEGHRLAFNKATRKVNGIEVVVDEERKISVVEPLTREQWNLFKSKRIPLEDFVENKDDVIDLTEE